MESGNTLIDAASRACGSRYKLAMHMQESLSFIGKVAAGKAPMPPGMAARMAVIAGLDARRAAMEALVSQEKDFAKRVALASALGLPMPERRESDGGSLQQIS